MREKQIEEMTEAIFHNCNCGLFFSEAEKIARFVIEEQGYVKQSDVAKEIFDVIEKCMEHDYISSIGVYNGALKLRIAELKKKYIGE